MSGRYSIWAIILLIVQCSSFFDKRTDLEKAVDHYQEHDLEKAVQYFKKYYKENPSSGTVLYYLHDCYKKMGDTYACVDILERLVDLNTKDVQVYVALYVHYHSMMQYDDLYAVLISAPQSVLADFNRRFVVTRELYTKLIVGALGVSAAYKDPIWYATVNNYIPVFLDGMFYEEDRITMGNLIIMNDRLMPPSYPGHFYPTQHISDHSFLYLPYMRLIDKKIIPYDKNLDPNAPVPLSLAMQVIKNMKQGGYFDQDR